MAIADATGGPPAWLTRLCTAFEEKCELLADAPATTIHGEFGPQNVLWQEGIIYPIDWESAAIGPGEIDLATLLFNWPADTVDRCIAAYWRARGETRPDSFAARWDAATLFTALRWLPDFDGPRGNAAGSTRGESLRQSLAMLERTVQSLGII
jgi:thiamine kinase-like enzyme